MEWVWVAVWFTGVWARGATLPPLNASGSFAGSWASSDVSQNYKAEFGPFGYFSMTLRPVDLSLEELLDSSHLHAVRGELLMRDTRGELRFFIDGIYDSSIGKVLFYANKPLWIEEDEMRSFINKSVLTHRNVSVVPLPPATEDPSDPGGVRVYSSCQLAGKIDFAEAIVGRRESGNVDPKGYARIESAMLYSRTKIIIQGNLVSRDCGFSVDVIAHQLALQIIVSKAITYAICTTLPAIGVVALLVRQMVFSLTSARATKLSLLCIGTQAVLDSYLSMFHLTTAVVVQQLFNPFIIPALIQFMTFGLFEMRLILLCHKARTPNAFNDWDSARRELGVIYFKFYIAMIGGMFLIYNFVDMLPFFTFILYSFWIPQIVRNVYCGTNKPLQTSYIIGISLLRLFVPLCKFGKRQLNLIPSDVFGCPNNFLGSRLDYGFCWVLCTYVAAQAFILIQQDYLGARFFIPRRFLPNYYDYYRALGKRSEDEMCTICMMNLWTPESDEEEPRSPEDLRIMLCPCNHAFHERCLLAWMEHKLECPSCRRALPPVQ
jgi:hypothetical protein